MKTTGWSRRGTKSIIETMEDEPTGSAMGIKNAKRTEEKLARLDRALDEGLLDSHMPGVDWAALERESIYRKDVLRRLGSAQERRIDSDDSICDAFLEHVELSFRCGDSAAECARRWLLRSN